MGWGWLDLSGPLFSLDWEIIFSDSEPFDSEASERCCSQAIPFPSIPVLLLQCSDPQLTQSITISLNTKMRAVPLNVRESGTQSIKIQDHGLAMLLELINTSGCKWTHPVKSFVLRWFKCCCALSGSPLPNRFKEALHPGTVKKYKDVVETLLAYFCKPGLL